MSARFRANVLLFILAIGFVGIAYLRRGSEAEQVVRTLVDSELVCDVDGAHETLRFLLEGTLYSERWRINQAPVDDAVNFYTICLHKSGGSRTQALDRLVGNCSYLGKPGIIFCDRAFLETFLLRRKIDRELSSFPSKAARSAISSTVTCPHTTLQTS